MNADHAAIFTVGDKAPDYGDSDDLLSDGGDDFDASGHHDDDGFDML